MLIQEEMHYPRLVMLSLSLLLAIHPAAADEELSPKLLATLNQYCIKCHNNEKAKGKVNLAAIQDVSQLRADPGLVKQLIDAVADGHMPPADQPQPEQPQRTALIESLKTILRSSDAVQSPPQNPISRLNRLQYNNAVRDLFEIKSDVLHLPEKLMTRHENYLTTTPGKMPDRVSVACESLRQVGGFQEVEAYPKDLRAQHGFDNQADQLTLSPLLLESFLKLSVSILESPDFNEQNVGIWRAFFGEPPAGADREAQVRSRLGPFLEQAFRSPVDEATRERYVAYALAQMGRGVGFTQSMKKTASAVLCSPRFLYRAADVPGDSFALASRLSFLLWASAPDPALLQLARSGELADPAVLNRTIDRMIADPKIAGFLDTFPAQWMQLENLLAAAPDPAKHRYYRLDEEHPASLHMVLEPLLLFDAVFIEDRPIDQLIAPSFGYRSDFLQAWYRSEELSPPKIDAQAIDQARQALIQQRRTLEQNIEKTQAQLSALIEEQTLTDAQTQAREKLTKELARLEDALKKAPVEVDLKKLQRQIAQRYDNDLRGLLKSRSFQRVPMTDPRYGGVMTNAATMTMTSSPKRTLPIARGVWVTEVILNDPPPPPPNDVPPLKEDDSAKEMTIREQFALHRESPNCAGCHVRIDPLGFALENYDITGRWRERYENGRAVDASGTLMQKHAFDGVVQFKAALVQEKQRFARAFTEHLLRFALARELVPADALTVDHIVQQAMEDDFRIRSILRHVILSDTFIQPD